ncbi:hypothetical protein NDU88_004363 [Pleurodeles waltl]|uniref:Uncharacterized protein n=1 Tax=Pleurodeles waltl TaxID=8319 RepID=A0AAV7T9I2_PLEWA|nr:hypothetical protein NDU88_004363 [Pleurodeles waltl]
MKHTVLPLLKGGRAGTSSCGAAQATVMPCSQHKQPSAGLTGSRTGWSLAPPTRVYLGGGSGGGPGAAGVFTTCKPSSEGHPSAIKVFVRCNERETASLHINNIHSPHLRIQRDTGMFTMYENGLDVHRSSRLTICDQQKKRFKMHT